MRDNTGTAFNIQRGVKTIRSSPSKRFENLTIQWTLHTFTTSVQHMSVDHGCPHIFVAQ
jgi:hypothetical protein